MLEMATKIAAAISIGISISQQHMTPTVEVENLRTSTISASCIKVEWNAEENRDYEVVCDMMNPDAGNMDDSYFTFESNARCYIEGLPENTAYKITVRPLLADGETAEMKSTSIYAHTEQLEAVYNLHATTISVSCIKVEWDAEDNRDYEVICATVDPDTGYVDNMYFEFKSNSLCYITGLRENSTYEITVKPVLTDGENAEIQSASTYAQTEQVEVIEEFPHETGWTNCFAYENVAGLTRNPSWSAIQGCIPDPITNTGIMRDAYGDYCVAMGTMYGYCGDRFLVELENGTQFTVKICDSKGNVPYHSFSGIGKCIVEFIHADGLLPDCTAYSGNYGYYSWCGMDLGANIASIQKINYGNRVDY